MVTPSLIPSKDQTLSLAIEHAMMISDDEAAIAALVFAPEVPRTRYELLGRICKNAEDAPGPGSPLALWCRGGTLDPHWRQRISTHPRSLYVTLENLRELQTLVTKLPEFSNCLEELRGLRTALDATTGPNLKEID
jgi:hypothetical protein